MKIMIYEDNELDIQALKNCIDTFFSKYSIPYQVDVCHASEKLLETIYNYDILFLDIELGNENGIHMGRIAKRKHKSCHIILTSKYKKYLIDGYSVKADCYLLKPLSQEQFNRNLKRVIHEYSFDTASILDKKISRKRILLKDILYIEYYDRHSYIKLTNKQRIVTPYSLGYWENKLKPYSFSQCYRSYLVNCRFVADIKQDYVFLLNEEHIPLSRGFKKNFISSWLESVENQL